MMNRRTLLTGAVLGPLAAPALVGLTVRPAEAQTRSSLPAVERYRIGALSVTAMSDGFLPIEAETMQGTTPEVFAERLAAARIDGTAHPTGVNVYLIETPTRRILVDAGAGSVMGPSLGRLKDQLDILGVTPESIDTLIATHLHPDHIGGAFVNGATPFSAATLVVSEVDRAFWTSAEMKAQAPEPFQPFFDLAAGTVAAFGERIKGISGEADLGEGLTAVPLPGHTPGHMGIRMESEGAQLLLWGDIIHVGPVQFADPGVTIAFDTDPDAARATRTRVFDMVSTDGLMVAGTHIGFPGIGYVEAAGSGYRFVPAPYPYLSPL
ncbi:MAG: MBL fold metallo-hydrolase [Pseudomonadota bacterium]